jgi:hypothetical protein
MYEIHFQVGGPFNFAQRDFLRVGCIQQVAVDGSGAQLFDFGERGRQQTVDPMDDLVSGGEVAGISHMFVIGII